MQPQSKSDGYAPKWRHFHPQSTVWVQNPFDHDVVFQVADERNVPYQYRMPAGKISELPGGAVATLGVKAIVDELIQIHKEDVFHMWDANVRAKHEDSIITRIKEAPVLQEVQAGGEVNLGLNNDVEEVNEPQEEDEVPFAPAPKSKSKRNKPADVQKVSADIEQPFQEQAASANVASIADASLAGKSDTILSSD